ncbi:hypothetical protein N0V91_007827, partial [Didymella pomorum]
MYKARSSVWAAKAERLQKLWNWVNASVSPTILSPVMVKLVTNKIPTLQSLVKALKEELAPTEASTKNQVRADYRQHLRAAKQGRAAPQDWFQKWSYLYRRAKAYELAEVDGELATQDFLDALSHRIAPEWARTMSQKLIQDTTLGLETFDLEKMSDSHRQEILQRLKQKEHKETKGAIEQLNWTSNAPLAITNGANRKVEFPGHIQAALIDPRMMQVLNEPVITKPGVYNLMDFNAHPLSESTILDNGAATHLVNSSDRLVPGTFRTADPSDTVEAGTQAFPIAGRGARLFKNALHGKRGPYTEDLLLQDVVVVEGFHVNIISEARLQEKGVWYLGLDSSLRVGYIDDLNGSV